MSTMTPADSATEANSSSLENAEFGMPPARQRLKSCDGAILEPDDRPELHHDLAALERAAHVVLERSPVRAHASAWTGANSLTWSPPAFFALASASCASASSSPPLTCSFGSYTAAPIDTVSAISRSPKLMGAASAARRPSSLAVRSRRGELGQDDDAELVPRQPRQRVARLQVARQAPRDREQRGSRRSTGRRNR